MESSQSLARECSHCNAPIPKGRRRDAQYCQAECKKKANDARWRQRSTGYMHKYRYGLSEEDFRTLLAEQGNVCAICGTDQWGGKHNGPHVDHDHDTGAVRGLLCHGCNMGIGWFRDEPERLQSAAKYLGAGG